MKNPCIILEGVVCQGRYSDCRMFCPREIFSYWREIWLERVDPSDIPPVGRREPRTDLDSIGVASFAEVCRIDLALESHGIWDAD